MSRTVSTESTRSRDSLIANQNAAYTTTANQITGYLFSEVTDFVNCRSQNCLGTMRLGKWNYQRTKRGGVVVYESESQFTNKTTCLLGNIRIKCTPAYFASYILNPDTRHYYDNSIKELELLQEVSEDINVYSCSFQTKNCIVTYTVNLCHLTAFRKEGDNYIIGYGSVPPHGNMETQPGVPTLWLHYSGYVIQPRTNHYGEIESEIFYIFQYDYKGELPVYIKTFAKERQMSQLTVIKRIIEKCLLSPGFSDSGESLSTASSSRAVSRQNSSSSSRSSTRSNRKLLRIPSTASLHSLGAGLRAPQRSKSVTSNRSPRPASRSPPLSMKSYSEPTLNDPICVFYVDSSEDEDETMNSIDPEHMFNKELPPTFPRKGSMTSKTPPAGSCISLYDYSAMAARAANALNTEHLEIIESARFATFQPEKYSWKIIDEKRRVLILEKVNSGVLHICGVAQVDTDPDTLVDYITNLANKVTFDKFLHRAHVVEEIGPDLQIVYLHFKTNLCLIAHQRDACAFCHVARQDTKVIIASGSCVHSACPTENNITRMTIYDSGFIVEPVPGKYNTCRLVYVSKVHLGPGYFPHSLLWYIKRRQPLLLARIASHFRVKEEREE